MVKGKYVVVADTDLTFLDDVSDSVCVFNREACGDGNVSKPYSVKEGINLYLEDALYKKANESEVE